MIQVHHAPSTSEDNGDILARKFSSNWCQLKSAQKVAVALFWVFVAFHESADGFVLVHPSAKFRRWTSRQRVSTHFTLRPYASYLSHATRTSSVRTETSSVSGEERRRRRRRRQGGAWQHQHHPYIGHDISSAPPWVMSMGQSEDDPDFDESSSSSSSSSSNNNSNKRKSDHQNTHSAQGEKGRQHRHLEEDISRRLSLESKDRAISALSQPRKGLSGTFYGNDGKESRGTSSGKVQDDSSSAEGVVAGDAGSTNRKNKQNKSIFSPSSSVFPPHRNDGEESNRNQSRGERKNEKFNKNNGGSKRRRRTTMKRNDKRGALSSSNQHLKSRNNTAKEYSSLLPPLSLGDRGKNNLRDGDDGGRSSSRNTSNRNANAPKRDSGTPPRRRQPRGGDRGEWGSTSSLLPPPLPPLWGEESEEGLKLGSDNGGDTSLSSWGEVLGNSDTASGNSNKGRGKQKSNVSSQQSMQRRPESGGDGGSSFLPPPFPSFDKDNRERGKGNRKSTGSPSSSSVSTYQLPSIDDLFPPDFSASQSSPPSNRTKGSKATSSTSSLSSKQSAALEGVLPVSELFYRSTQSISAEEDEEEDVGTSHRGGRDEKEGDDEELPFSAEQSDSLTTNNHVRIRRNQAGSAAAALLDTDDETLSESDESKSGREQKTSKRDKGKKIDGAESTGGKRDGKSRKMVRRGMEMLVGGIPINADPPQRSIELTYDRLLAESAEDWYRAVTLNSRDFGPLLHTGSVKKVNIVERGLYCEHFVHSAMKWDICPRDLRDIVKGQAALEDEKFGVIREENRQMRAGDSYEGLIEQMASPSSLSSVEHSSITDGNSKDRSARASETVSSYEGKGSSFPFRTGGSDNSNILSLLRETNEDDIHEQDGDEGSDGKEFASEDRPTADLEPRGFGPPPPRGFGKKSRKKDRSGTMSPPSSFHSVHDLEMGVSSGNRAARRQKQKQGLDFADIDESAELQFTLGGELRFTIAVTRAELESGHGGASGHVLRRVLARGVKTAISADDLGYDVKIAKMVLKEVEGGATDISVEFNMIVRERMRYADIEKEAKRINAKLAQAMDDGDMALAMAASAKEEKSWSAKVRDRVVEEFLFENDDGDDEPVMRGGLTEKQGQLSSFEKDDDDELHASENDSEAAESQAESFSRKTETPPEGEDTEDDDAFGMSGGEPLYSHDDLFLGDGNGGVFYDFSETSAADSPFGGRLGPLLVDSVVAQAMQRQPRVIAIGDVHGCIDELQDLLRRCDYRPGDLVVFLGDLVSKGPDSISVVQMAREIGAIGVRGNHDFEVIRWHQAMKSGVDPPVVGSEHFHIASCLSKADLKWMYSLPWYISSKELGALFVHAGFVSGIRLAKQNPRLMMNMRSILPDGTVTSKFFNNWPWARLWDGPQTVLFGHDADRGLQQYEHAIGLDTGCVYGGRLTACILPEKRLVSVSARREYFKYRRKHYD